MTKKNKIRKLEEGKNRRKLKVKKQY